MYANASNITPSYTHVSSYVIWRGHPWAISSVAHTYPCVTIWLANTYMVDIWATSTNQKLLIIIKIIISPHVAIFVDSTKCLHLLLCCMHSREITHGEPTFLPCLATRHIVYQFHILERDIFHGHYLLESREIWYSHPTTMATRMDNPPTNCRHHHQH